MEKRKQLVKRESVTIKVQGRKTTESVLFTGDQVLIGRIALAKLDLVVDNKNQCLTQNPKHTNYPVFRI